MPNIWPCAQDSPFMRGHAAADMVLLIQEQIAAATKRRFVIAAVATWLTSTARFRHR